MMRNSRGIWLIYPSLIAPILNLPPTPVDYQSAWSEPDRVRTIIYPALQVPVPVIPATPVDYQTAWSEPDRVRTVIYPSRQEPVPVLQEVITPDKWWQPLAEPVRVKPGLKAALQRPTFNDPDYLADPPLLSKWYQPWSEPVRQKIGLRPSLAPELAYGTSITPTPIDFASAWSEPEYSITVLVPDWAPPAAVETVTLDKWWQPYSDPVRIRQRLAAAAQPWTWDDPFLLTQPEAVYESKWHLPWSEPVRQKPGLGAALQQPTAFVPLVTPPIDWQSHWYEPDRISAIIYPPRAEPIFPPETITPDKWWQALSEPVRTKPRLHSALQPWEWDDPFLLTQPEAVLESKWHQPWAEPVRTKQALRTALQQALAFLPPTPETILPDKWWQPWSEPVRIKRGLAAALQRATFDDPDYLADPPLLPKWYQPFAEPVRAKLRNSAALAPYTWDDPFQLTQPEAVQESKWHQPWAEPVRSKRILHPATQGYWAAGLFPLETVTLDKWWQPYSEPVRIKPALRTALHPYEWDDNKQLTLPEAPLLPKWYQPYAEPVRTKQALRTAAQPFVAAVPFVETVTVDKWFQPLAEPVRSKQGLRAAAQPFLTYVRFPEVVTLDKWYSPLAEPVRFRRLPAALVPPIPWIVASLPTTPVDYQSAWSEPDRVRTVIYPSIQTPLPIVIPPVGTGVSWIDNSVGVTYQQSIIYQSKAEPVFVPPPQPPVFVDSWWTPWTEPKRFHPSLLWWTYPVRFFIVPPPECAGHDWVFAEDCGTATWTQGETATATWTVSESAGNAWTQSEICKTL